MKPRKLKVLYIGSFNGKNSDEGFTQISKRITELLKNSNQIMTLNTLDVIKIRNIIKILKFKPDIIQVDQAFPFIGLKKILGDLGRKPKIVYSSQNIEAPMRKEIMVLGGSKKKDIDQAFSVINDTEIYLAKNADLLVTVCESDGKSYLSKGAKKYVLAMNSASPIISTSNAKLYWKKYMRPQLKALLSLILLILFGPYRRPLAILLQF